MPRTAEEQAAIERFGNIYSHARDTFMQEIERSVCGCDYGGTSWTTRAEADNVIERLQLGPGQLLLEVGAGSGWPGLYLAKESGCDIAQVDLPFEGLRIAKERAVSDNLAGTHWVAQGDGATLPFRVGAFDAIFHSDVLCCLVEKRAVLESCRRVIRPGGAMVFSVIYITPDIDADARALALAGGPPFVATPAPYAHMLGETSWRLVNRLDLTGEYLESTRRHVAGLEAHRDEIAKAFGADDAADMVTKRRATVSALESGALRRELFEAAPAS